MSATFLGDTLTVLAAYIAWSFWQWKRLAHIPGPFWAGVSKVWLIREGIKHRQPFAFKEVTDRYGPIARVGPNELVTDDPEILRRMMAARSKYTRGPWYDTMRLEPGKGNLLSTRDDVAHTKLKNKMAAGYSGKENESMEATIDKQIALFVELIQTRYISTNTDYKPVDLAQKVQFFTLDVISDLAFGRPFGYLEKNEDPYDYIEILASFVPVMMFLSDVPSLAKVLHSQFMRGLLPKDSDKFGFGAFIRVAKEAVAARFARLDLENKRRTDMLGSFIRHGLTQEECQSESLLQVAAGSDTSATTIRAALLQLLTHPSCYRALQKEIDEAIAAGNISSPITDAEGRALPYLQAVIKESMRMKPPASGIFYKTVPLGGDTLHGHFIPEGTQIGSSPLGLHHSKSIFGADADIFRPERWLDAPPEKLEKMNSASELIFHWGKYQCPGKSVALMEFNKVFVEVFRRFDMGLVDPETPAKFMSAGIWLVQDFWVRVEERT